jgi:hypothetical protein
VTMTLKTTEVDLDQVKQCKYCREDIVFILSTRTGKNYPVNFTPDHPSIGDKYWVSLKDFHNCRSI